MSGRSEVWQHFEKNGKDSAKCKKCGDPISCKGSNTSGMLKHLRTKHKIEITTKSQSSSASEETSSSASVSKKLKQSSESAPVFSS